MQFVCMHVPLLAASQSTLERLSGIIDSTVSGDLACGLRDERTVYMQYIQYIWGIVRGFRSEAFGSSQSARAMIAEPVPTLNSQLSLFYAQWVDLIFRMRVSYTSTGGWGGHGDFGFRAGAGIAEKERNCHHGRALISQALSWCCIL